MFEDIYIVYIRIDDANRVTEVNSSAFISDCSGWIEIDRGSGDRFHHAQGNYFPKSIIDIHGVYRYKYDNGAVCERSDKEIEADIPPVPPEPPTRAELAAAIAELAEGMCSG